MAAVRLGETSQWWSAQRRRYNAIVIAAGGICFVLYGVIANGVPDVEITVFTLGLQAVGGLLYMLAANVAYSLGSVMEGLAQPANVRRFRLTLFLLGVTLTIAPAVAVPVLLFCRRLAA